MMHLWYGTYTHSKTADYFVSARTMEGISITVPAKCTEETSERVAIMPQYAKNLTRRLLTTPHAPSPCRSGKVARAQEHTLETTDIFLGTLDLVIRLAIVPT